MSLYDIQLKDLCKFYKIPLNGIYMRDQLQNVVPKRGFYLINMEPLSAMRGGTHWLCAYIGRESSLFNDSFGGTCGDDIYAFLKRYDDHRPIVSNRFIIQDIKSSLCGYYCVAMAMYLHAHPNTPIEDSFNDYINLFDNNSRVNSGILLRFYRGFKRKHKLIESHMARNV